MEQIDTWPGWECVQQLGAGAFGKVYEIQKEENGKVYKAALKVISIPQGEADIESAYSEGMSEVEITNYYRSLVDKITNEFALMSDLKGYTNIVSYEDHMVVEREGSIGWDILVRMELLTPLHKWIINNPLDEKEVIRMGCDICRALELCHKNKIIHRDIKPENIFVNKNGDFKLGDFGIARVVEKTTNIMSERSGTETYMAPEVFKGQYYNHTADIYSLGVVLYRFLNNNRTPFLPQGTLLPSDRKMALDCRMSGEKIPAPINGSEKLKQAVLVSLEYDLQKRFQNAQSFRRILEQCSDGTGQWIPLEKEDVPQIPKLEDDLTHRKKGTVIAPQKKKKNWILPVGIIVAILVLILIVVGAGDNDSVPSKNPSSQSVSEETEQITAENHESSQVSEGSDGVTLDEASIILNEEGKVPVVWELPTTLDEFEKRGWESDLFVDLYIEPGHSYAELTKNNSTCTVYLYNDSDSAKRVGDCLVVGVVVFNAMKTYIELEGGINLDSSIEDFEKVYGEPSELYNESGYVYANFSDDRIHFMTGYEQGILYLIPGFSYDNNFFYEINEDADAQEDNDMSMYISVVLKKPYDNPDYNGSWESFYEVCNERGIYCEIYWPDSPDDIAQQVSQVSTIVESHKCDILFVEAPDEYSMKAVIDEARDKGISVIGLNDYMKNTDTNSNDWKNWGEYGWNRIFDLVFSEDVAGHDATEGGIHSYQVVMDNCSWDEAYQKALDMGGYLVRINSEEEYEHLTSMLEENEYYDILLRLGARRDPNATEYYWIDENNKCYGEHLNNSDYWTSSHWKDGEPNFRYEEVEEECVEMHCKAGETRWVWNDIPNDVVESSPYYRDRVGFIVEYD